MKTDLFQSCGHCWVFQICWHFECITFIATFFRIWNNSTGIPSLPLAFFVVMLPKAVLTLLSRMSGCEWLWLSGSRRSFLYSSSVYSCYLFLISSASVRSIPFLFFIVPIFAWNVPLVFQIFLKRWSKFREKHMHCLQHANKMNSIMYSQRLINTPDCLHYSQHAFFFFFKFADLVVKVKTDLKMMSILSYTHCFLIWCSVLFLNYFVKK